MKYLIDDDLRDRLLTILTVTERWNTREMVESLKPIEPLSDDVLDSLWVTTPDDPDGNDFVPFARAIEAHILGETE